MLKKPNRLTKRGSFSYVYKNGKRCYSKLLTLVFIQSKSLKIGFSVNNKIGKANVRNKLKRRLRAIVKDNADKLINVQAVFVAKPGLENLSFDELVKVIQKLLNDSKIYKQEAV